MNEIILQWAWYFLVVAVVIICSSKLNTWLAIKKETNNINAYNIHGTTPHDDEAVKITVQDKRITSSYNPRGEYTNYFAKGEKGFINALDENAIVFYVAEA